MFVLSSRLIAILLLMILGCKGSKTKQISIQDKYFEEFQNKKVTEGHYGGYFILDGNKHIYKLHLSNNEEIIIESDSDVLSYSGDDFRKNMVILYNGSDVFRAVKGRINVVKSKDKLEVSLSVMGIKDLWEFVSDYIPIVEDGNHHIVFF